MEFLFIIVLISIIGLWTFFYFIGNDFGKSNELNNTVSPFKMINFGGFFILLSGILTLSSFLFVEYVNPQSLIEYEFGLKVLNVSSILSLCMGGVCLIIQK